MAYVSKNPQTLTIHILRIAHPHLRNTGIMVARLPALCRGPRIHMNVVHARALRLDRVRHKDVIDLLRVLFVDVCIALRRRDTCDLVDVGEEFVEGHEDTACLEELVHVAADDDMRAGIESQ